MVSPSNRAKKHTYTTHVCVQCSLTSVRLSQAQLGSIHTQCMHFTDSSATHAFTKSDLLYYSTPNQRRDVLELSNETISRIATYP